MAPITSAIRRQMTDEGARVTADRDEFLAVCDAVDSIHARRLRALDASTARVDELCRENEKLRGLVRDVNKAAHMLCEAWEGSCSKEAEGMSLHAVCPISDTSELCVFGKLDDRMRELGIEVGG